MLISISSPNSTKTTLKYLGSGVPQDFDQEFLWLHPSKHFPNFIYSTTIIIFFCYIRVPNYYYLCFSFKSIHYFTFIIYFRRKVCTPSVAKSNCTHKHTESKAVLLTVRDIAVCWAAGLPFLWGKQKQKQITPPQLCFILLSLHFLSSHSLSPQSCPSLNLEPLL